MQYRCDSFRYSHGHVQHSYSELCESVQRAYATVALPPYPTLSSHSEISITYSFRTVDKKCSESRTVTRSSPPHAWLSRTVQLQGSRTAEEAQHRRGRNHRIMLQRSGPQGHLEVINKPRPHEREARWLWGSDRMRAERSLRIERAKDKLSESEEK